MKSSDIFDGITDIRDDLVENAGKVPQKRRFPVKKPWLGAAAAALVLVILGGILLAPGGGPVAYAITEAEYPKMAPYPESLGEFNDSEWEAWWEDMHAQQRDLGDISSLQNFFAQSSQTFLSGAPGENRVYSPLNVYMALGMLSQLTSGSSQEQILSLLGSGSIEDLRQQAGDVWNSNYRDDGVVTSILASSLWLNENVKFNQDTLDTLASDFYASSYCGKMGSEEMDKALQDWLNEQTGGLLKEQAGNIQLDRDTILALASTVYFKAKWGYEFFEGNTQKEVFHAPAGDMETDFMHQQAEHYYYWGDKFSAVEQHFTQGGFMWFLLPDEGVAPEELLADEEAVDFLFAVDKNEWENQKFLVVNKSVPKFDVSSQFDLIEGLQALGVTDVFDPALSDFSPMTKGGSGPIFLAQVNHAARVKIDEKGCEAAAFTVMNAVASAMPPEEEVDFVLNRPFLFCITGDSGLPLFVGVVNQPLGA